MRILRLVRLLCPQGANTAIGALRWCECCDLRQKIARMLRKMRHIALWSAYKINTSALMYEQNCVERAIVLTERTKGPEILQT